MHGGREWERRLEISIHALKHLSPAALSGYPTRGGNLEKDCRIPGPVGALIKLPGSHSRTHMVSKTMLSSNFCWLFCFEGQRVPLNSFLLFPLCGGHRVCSRQAGQHSPRARATLTGSLALAGALLSLICFLFAPSLSWQRVCFQDLVPTPDITAKGDCDV